MERHEEQILYRAVVLKLQLEWYSLYFIQMEVYLEQRNVFYKIRYFNDKLKVLGNITRKLLTKIMQDLGNNLLFKLCVTFEVYEFIFLALKTIVPV